MLRSNFTKLTPGQILLVLQKFQHAVHGVLNGENVIGRDGITDALQALQFL